jgi:hypothetical protein
MMLMSLCDQHPLEFLGREIGVFALKGCVYMEESRWVKLWDVRRRMGCGLVWLEWMMKLPILQKGVVRCSRKPCW